MNLRNLFKKYYWNDAGLKRKYQIYDWATVILTLMALLIAKLLVYPMLYLGAIIILIIVCQWQCHKIKKQDEYLLDEEDEEE